MNNYELKVQVKGQLLSDQYGYFLRAIDGKRLRLATRKSLYNSWGRLITLKGTLDFDAKNEPILSV